MYAGYNSVHLNSMGGLDGGGEVNDHSNVIIPIDIRVTKRVKLELILLLVFSYLKVKIQYSIFLFYIPIK